MSKFIKTSQKHKQNLVLLRNSVLAIDFSDWIVLMLNQVGCFMWE